MSKETFEKYGDKEQHSKEWEIVSYSYRNRIYKKNNLGEYSASFDSPIHELILHPENMTKIYYVKRISDNEVFTIGDKVDVYDYSGRSIVIEKFSLDNNTIYVFSGTFTTTIQHISKSPKTITPTPVHKEEIKLPLSQIKHLYELWGSLKTGNSFMEFVYSRVIF